MFNQSLHFGWESDVASFLSPIWYHTLLSTLLAITASWRTTKLSSLFDYPSNPLFPFNRQHWPSGLHQKIIDSQLILNPLSSLEDLLDLATTQYYLITPTFMPHSSPNSPRTPPNLGLPHTIKPSKLFAGDYTSRAKTLTNLKSATYIYHKLVIAAKKKYYSSHINSSSHRRRLHRDNRDLSPSTHQCFAPVHVSLWDTQHIKDSKCFTSNFPHRIN